MEILFVATTLLALGILFRRLRKAEAELDQWRAKAEDPSQPLVLEGDNRSVVVSAMTAILGQCDMARGQANPDGRLLQVIERQAQRVWDLLERHSLPVSMPLEPVRPIIPEDLARAAIHAEGALAESRDVKVHLLVDETPPVKASAALLANALQQLVRAAVLSVPRGKGDVTVAVGCLPPGVETTHVGLCVADDGPGFDPTSLLEILEPPEGEEAEPGTPERCYALAYSMCRAMRIGFVMDSAPGAGTRTTIKLPLKPAATAEATPEEAATAEATPEEAAAAEAMPEEVAAEEATPEEVPHVAVPEEALPGDVSPDEALTEDLSPVPAPRTEA
ncbi:MAG: ATP-binding protein [Planctomycetota bacterium]